MNLRQLDRKYLGRESDAEDLQVARTKGAFVYDARGKRYIDFCRAGASATSAGTTPRSRNRRRAGLRITSIRSTCTGPWVELAQLLAEITPGKLEKTYRATGGSEAVEIALQLAMASTGRRKFVSIEGSYHGNTIGTVSVASTEEREPYPNLLSNCMTISPPLGDRAIARLETLLKKRDVAAFLMEPISCNLAVLIPDDAFMKRAQQLCRRYGTLFIADEVACGFGRTGKLFASEYFDLEPDILCMGKAISGGFAPMGATIATRKVAKSVEGKAGFYSTYAWHPSAVDVAIRNVRWVIANQSRLLEHAAGISAYFGERLAAQVLWSIRDRAHGGKGEGADPGPGLREVNVRQA